MAGLLDTIAEAYMRNVGNPARQLVGGGVRGLLGFDPPEYADSLGMEAYRNAQALSNAPTPLAFAALPAAMVKGAKAAKAAPRAEALETARQNAVKMLGLPENNTAMDRAKALGFNVEAFHGTNKAERNAGVSNNLGSSPSGISGGDDLLRDRGESSAIRSLLPGGTWFHKDPGQAFASGEGAYVIPSLIRLDNPIKRSSYFGMENFSDPSRFKYFDKDKKKFVTPDGVVGDNGVVVAFNPSQVRSRFAAFDPARVNENDLLGRADPALLALIAAGTALPVGYGLLTSNKDAKK